MSWASFNTKVSGKWVLAGEHSVLRGATAIALPRFDLQLSLGFEPGDTNSGLEVEPQEASSLVQELLRLVLNSKADLGRFRSPAQIIGPQGKLKIESTIPMGAGLGSSAALCVALTRWLAGPLSLPESQWAEFATELEHHFHGRSSGMDVAVISAQEAVSFVRGRGASPLGVTRLPHFTFHDTDLRSRTSDCVLKVENFRKADPAGGERIDGRMAEASQLAREGLVLFDSGTDDPKALRILAESMSKSQDCFYSWGLVPDPTREMEKALMAQGALAVKITGAGGGGILVALWG